MRFSLRAGGLRSFVLSPGLFVRLLSLCVCAQIVCAGAPAGAQEPSVSTVEDVDADRCVATLLGGDFSEGEELIFVGLRKGRKVTVRITVVRPFSAGTRYLARIEKKGKLCPSVRGFRFSRDKSFPLLRDLYVVKASVDMGSVASRVKGLNAVSPGGEQNLPGLVQAGLGLQVFPFQKLSSDFLGQSLGVFSQISGAVSPQGDWAIESGGTVAPQLVVSETGVILRPFIFGHSHPTQLLFGYKNLDLTFEQTKKGTYTRSVLRSVQCEGPHLSLAQTIAVTPRYEVHFGAGFGPAPECRTPALTFDDALLLESQQVAAGKTGDDVTGSDQIANRRGLKEPVWWQAQVGFDHELGFGFRWGMEFASAQTRADLQLERARLPMFLNTSSLVFRSSWQWN